MNKIFSININIPANDNDFVSFDSHTSLSDADIVLFRPNAIVPLSRFNSYWQKEIDRVLSLGKTIFILLTTPTSFNYDFLPNLKNQLIQTNRIEVFPKLKISEAFHNLVSNYWSVGCLLNSISNGETLFASKNNDRILGAIFKINSGHLILIPDINFLKAISEINTKGAISVIDFGKAFKRSLSDIHNSLNVVEELSEKPEWANLSEFEIDTATKLSIQVETNLKAIESLVVENDDLLDKIKEIEVIKNLLFETGKPLEKGVTRALKILGYSTENYDDGVLELDQVIISPEGERFIGECEGKDNKAIDVSKFRQLQDALNEDFHRDEIDEKAYGILFGNPQRLLNPSERTLDFTDKCKNGAKRELIGLVNTVDLFEVTKYLSENDNEEFKIKCRQAIKDQLGQIIQFPEVPI